MAGEKVTVEFEINVDSQALLQDIVEKYKLPNSSKAIRVLLDYVARDGDQDVIFKKIRCRRCG